MPDLQENVISNHSTTSGGLELTVVIPVFNEVDNVERMVAALDAALLDIKWEAVFVDDDSPDGTANKITDVAKADPRVRLIHRVGRRGLSSAAIEGMMSSTAEYVAVIDGDLQHDERILPEMLQSVREGADIAIGTRYVEGGSTGDWDETRERISRFATWVSHKMTRVELNDPMSGFFLLARETFLLVVHDLSGLGFKILLDILTTAKPALKIAEVPYTFREREEGESKLDTSAAWDFSMLLIDKNIGKLIPVRFVSFAFVGGLGIFVHFLALTAMFQMVGKSFLWAQTTAMITSMVFNYWLNNLLTYRDRRRTGMRWITGLISFVVICSLGGAANVGVANFLYGEQTHWVLSALAGILVGAVWNYAATSLYTWRN